MENYTKETYDKTMELRKQNLGAKRISRILKIPKGTIDGWLYREKKPKIISKKYKIAQEKNKRYLTGSGWNRKTLPEVAKKLSADLAYICGVILGDGYIDKRSGIELLVKDKDFAEIFALYLRRWSTLAPKIYKYKYFVACLNSREVAKFFIEDLNKLVNQILKIRDERTICMFLRGLFDSEGSALYDKKRGIARVSMRITNKKIAKYTRYLLAKIGISSNFYIKKRKMKQWKTCYEVAIQKRQMQKLFLEKVGFSIERKQKVLGEACCAEFLERADIPHHGWYRKAEIEFLKKYYGSIKVKEIVDMLNNKFWDGNDVRTLNGIYTKASDLQRVEKW